MDTLSDDECAALRLSLLKLEQELGNAHESSADGARPVDLDEPIGRLSRMDAIQQQRMLQANRGSLAQRLAQVRGALQRLDDAEYGVCVTCGENVGFRRLEAQPEAPFCIACQSRREQRD
jgi:DnaK suppressor protein